MSRKLHKLIIEMKWLHCTHRFQIKKEALAILAKTSTHNIKINCLYYENILINLESKLWLKVPFS